MPAHIRVFTYKEGLLSRVAHDLRLSFPRFEITLDAGEVRASVELASLHVDGVMKDGVLREGDLSDRDRRKIRDHALGEVLQAVQHPHARFTGHLSGAVPPRLEGSLALRGRTASLSEPRVDLEGTRGPRVQATLAPSTWGIAPFRALGGSLRVRDRVDVEVEVPWGELSRSPTDWGQLRVTLGGADDAARGPGEI